MILHWIQKCVGSSPDRATFLQLKCRLQIPLPLHHSKIQDYLIFDHLAPTEISFGHKYSTDSCHGQNSESWQGSHLQPICNIKPLLVVVAGRVAWFQFCASV